MVREGDSMGISLHAWRATYVPKALRAVSSLSSVGYRWVAFRYHFSDEEKWEQRG